MTVLHTYESLEVGMHWCSSGRTLTESELSWACMSSGDWHPIHADAAYAAGTPVGQRIFQGSYGLHLAVGMATRLPELGDAVIAALGFQDWRFLAPLFVGDTVHVEVTLSAKRPTRDGVRGVLERRIRLCKQDGTIAQEGVWNSLVRMAPTTGAAT